MPDWKTLSSQEVYKTAWFTIKKDQVAIHTGKELTYSYMVLPHPAVTIVAVNHDGEVLLQKNYRYTLRTRLWELPAGNSDGEEPLTAAKRELLEETGLVSDDWLSLGEVYMATGVASIQQHMFLARGVKPQTDERDEDEDISSQCFISRTKITDMLRSNDIVDSDSVIALYKYLAIST